MMETTTKTAITVETSLNAPVEKVWKYWTEPDHITKWYQASDDWHAPFAENDLKVDGKFRTTMAAKDGSMSFDFWGTYTHVVPLKQIAFTLGDGRKVQVDFDAEGSKTKVTETFDPEASNPIEMQKAGWQAILESFRKYTEGN